MCVRACECVCVCVLDIIYLILLNHESRPISRSPSLAVLWPHVVGFPYLDEVERGRETEGERERVKVRMTGEGENEGLKWEKGTRLRDECQTQVEDRYR